MKHNMPAVECKLNQLINEDKKLINNLPSNWIQPSNRQLKTCRV